MTLICKCNAIHLIIRWTLNTTNIAIKHVEVVLSSFISFSTFVFLRFLFLFSLFFLSLQSSNSVWQKTTSTKKKNKNQDQPNILWSETELKLSGADIDLFISGKVKIIVFQLILVVFG